MTGRGEEEGIDLLYKKKSSGWIMGQMRFPPTFNNT